MFAICELSVKRKTEGSSGENWRQRDNAEASEADQARKADLRAADEASARAGRMAMSEMRVAGESAGPPQDQAQPVGERLPR